MQPSSREAERPSKRDKSGEMMRSDNAGGNLFVEQNAKEKRTLSLRSGSIGDVGGSGDSVFFIARYNIHRGSAAHMDPRFCRWGPTPMGPTTKRCQYESLFLIERKEVNKIVGEAGRKEIRIVE